MSNKKFDKKFRSATTGEPIRTDRTGNEPKNRKAIEDRIRKKIDNEFKKKNKESK